MPIPKPQFNKTLQRVKMTSQIDSAMEYSQQISLETAQQIKLLSVLFDKTIQHLKNENLEDFFRKQPLVDKELSNLVSMIKELKKGLEALAKQSPFLSQFLENVDVSDIEKSAALFVGQFEKLTVTDSKKSFNGNGVKADGSANGSNGTTETNGSNGTNGSDPSDLVIDPLSWQPTLPKVPTGKEHEVRVSYVHSPSSFFVHPFSGSNRFLMKVQAEQKNLVLKGITSLHEIVAGMYCAARYQKDFYWYRAKVIDVIRSKGRNSEIEKVKIFYLDYGNFDEVGLDDLMPLAKTLTDKKLLAIHCRFSQLDSSFEWPKEATEDFIKMVDEQPIKCYFAEPEPKMDTELGTVSLYPVELFTMEGKSVIEAINKYITSK